MLQEGHHMMGVISYICDV